MDYFTKWPEAYDIPNQETSKVAEALVANFFYRFGIPRELNSDQGRDFESRLLQKVLPSPGSEQEAHHAPAPAVGLHGGELYQNSRKALKKGCRIPPEGLGREITPLSPSLQGIHSRHCGFDPS
jgi:hypothetical protein